MPLNDVQRPSEGGAAKIELGNRFGRKTEFLQTNRAPTPLQNAAQFLLIDPIKDSAVLFLGNEGNVSNVSKNAQDPMAVFKRKGVYGS